MEKHCNRKIFKSYIHFLWLYNFLWIYIIYLFFQEKPFNIKVPLDEK